MLNEYPFYVSLESLILSDERAETDDSLSDLADSMRALGVLQPIVIVAAGDESGRYKVVCGRRRVQAARQIGMHAIPCVLNKMDDLHQRMSTISENLHRKELTSERDAAIAEYIQCYEILYPGYEESLKQRRLASQARAILDEGEEVPTEPIVAESSASEGPDAPVAEPVPLVESPIAAAAKTFRVSKGTITKAIRRARTFTVAQRKVLDMAKITAEDRDQLVEEDPETIDQVVKAIAAGFSFDESMRTVYTDQGRTYSKAPEPPFVPSDILKNLAARRQIRDPEAFDADAVMYHQLMIAVKDFKRRVNWEMIKTTIGASPHGLYYRRLSLLLECPPPRSWYPCLCQSKPGAVSVGCNSCRGGGYQIGG